MEAHQNNSLPDIQSSGDERNIHINRVGVRGIELPIAVADEDGVQHTVAKLAMTVALPADRRGTHMSRFIAIMESQSEPFTAQTAGRIAEQMLSELDACESTFEVRFPFFLRKSAPVII